MNYFNAYLREVLRLALPVSYKGKTVSAHANRAFGTVIITFSIRRK